MRFPDPTTSIVMSQFSFFNPFPLWVIFWQKWSWFSLMDPVGLRWLQSQWLVQTTEGQGRGHHPLKAESLIIVVINLVASACRLHFLSRSRKKASMSQQVGGGSSSPKYRSFTQDSIKIGCVVTNKLTLLFHIPSKTVIQFVWKFSILSQ